MVATTTASAPAAVEREPQRALRHDLLLVLTIALGVRLLFGLLISDTYDYDEFVLLLLSRDYAHGAVPYSGFLFFHPPGMLVLLRALAPATDLWWPLGRVAMGLVDSVTAVLVWKLGLLLWDARRARVAGILYACSPLSAVAAVRVGQDPVITMLATLGLVVLFSRRDQRGALVAGLLLAAAIWIKYPAVYFLPIYALAAPRRVLAILMGLVVGTVALFAPFHAQLAQLQDQTITFQRARWLMAPDVRIETTLLFWLAVSPLALIGLALQRRPIWLVGGYLLGGIFVLTSQVYYHYFVLVIPFAALASTPAATWATRFPRRALALLFAVLAAWAGLLRWGGPSPLYVTAAHLSQIAPTIRLVETTTRPTQPVLADRLEYAYLAHRPELDDYFWNVGVLVNAKYLETRLGLAGAVVLSYDASDGFPDGFEQFLNARYQSIRTPANTVWILSRPVRR